jgi:hypothetical protein
MEADPMLSFVKNGPAVVELPVMLRTHKYCELQCGKEVDPHQPTVFLQISPHL